MIIILIVMFEVKYLAKTNILRLINEISFD